MKPLAWYDPTNGMVSTDKDSPLFTPLGQIWPLYLQSEQVEEIKNLRGEIETLGAMYELASKQRNALMDEQRAQVAAWRAEHAITKAKNV